MKAIIEQLFELQQAEAVQSPNSAETQQRIESLRRSIPEPILGHYNRLRARGKSGVSLMRGGVCTGCHMKLASGVVAAVIRGDDINICDSCGRYLKLEPQAPAPPPPPPKPRSTRGRKPKTALDASHGG
jgi:predicted  nucleic acid-binding Zn-ribbon protein